MTEASSRNAVVTGAAGGMGRAITKALIESGRRVVLADRDPASLREFAAEMGDKTFPIELDITDAKAVARLPDLIPDAFKPVDILINNAGHDIGGRTRFDAGAADDQPPARHGQT
jgi:3-hydroxy acid dehydrogenase/malonic semialdehyde reductase